MEHDHTLARLLAAMTTFDRGDPRRIQHFIKVHSLARTIALLEGVDPETRFVLEAAALVHDIAICPCEAALGRCDGKIQEEYGPGYARTLLEELQLDPQVIQRVCWLVGHHHSYDHIQAIDHQILVEADFLVNLYEDGVGQQAVRTALDKVFRTQTGIRLCRDMFRV